MNPPDCNTLDFWVNKDFDIFGLETWLTDTTDTDTDSLDYPPGNELTSKPKDHTDHNTLTHTQTHVDHETLVKQALNAYNTRLAEKFENCRQIFVILQCDNCGSYYVKPISCDIRLCPDCARKRGKRLFDRYYEPLLSAVRAGKRLMLLTLTIKNTSDLADGFKLIKTAFQKLRRWTYFRRRVEAGIYVYEITTDQNGLYHVHVHVILVGRYFGKPTEKELRYLEIPARLSETKGIKSKEDLLSYNQTDIGQIILSAVWEQLTNSYVVDIRTVRSPKKALRYLLKYVTKPPNFPKTENYLDYLKTFAHTPLIVSFGGLRGVKEVKPVLMCDYCGSVVWRYRQTLLSEELKDWLAISAHQLLLLSRCEKYLKLLDKPPDQSQVSLIT